MISDVFFHMFTRLIRTVVHKTEVNISHVSQLTEPFTAQHGGMPSTSTHWTGPNHISSKIAGHCLFYKVLFIGMSLSVYYHKIHFISLLFYAMLNINSLLLI